MSEKLHVPKEITFWLLAGEESAAEMLKDSREGNPCPSAPGDGR